MSVKVAINGFGRIGRLAFRIMFSNEDFEIVAINDLTSAEELAYLLKYDSSQGKYDKDVSFEGNDLIVEGKKFQIFSERDPENLPWKEKKVDVVLECTGIFTSEEGANKHIKAGANKVLISAPAKGNIPTVVYGVNDDILTGKETFVSAA